MIEVKNLGKSYGSLEAVKGVDFRIDAGEVVGLLGPNGAGKTTIMKILTCFLYPSTGQANVAGYDIFEDPLEIKKVVGYLPENAPLYGELSVREYLDFIADSRQLNGELKQERLETVIGECGLTSIINRSISTLSKGYRQRVGLAQAILHNPSILILDEPTSGLDPSQIIEIRELIKRLGREKTVILSTHILQEVEAACSKVMILNEGKIAAKGTTEEIQREMKGETLLELIVRSPQSPEAFLVKVPGVARLLAAAPLENGKFELRLALERGEAEEDRVQEAVFDCAVRNGFKILSMVPQRLSLEDIFIKLTREG